MWEVYSKSYISGNRASGITIAVAALVATMFLSLLCSLSYNLWMYDLEKVILEEGDWHCRISGEISREDMSLLRQFPNVADVSENTELSGEQRVVDLRFRKIRTAYRDGALLAAQLGLEDRAITFHDSLLAQFFVHNPGDSQPPMLLALYAAVLCGACLSLVLIIRNSFELSMQARIHQFGILSSVGATPKQIRLCLVQEAVVLCGLPILFGSLLGIGISAGLIGAINFFAAEAAGRHPAVFQYCAAVFAVTLISAGGTVLLSVWLPARKLSKQSLMEAIREGGGLRLKRRKHSRLLGALFGIEGTLAGNALKAQKKALRLANLSLLLSLLGFSVMLCFTTLSSISTRHTYFERYQDNWDVMVTLRDTDISKFTLTGELRKLPDAREVTVYQTAQGICILDGQAQSPELLALGGYGAVEGQGPENGTLRVKAPIVILDDDSFLAFCSQTGIEPSLEGVIILNRIWDNVNSSFRYKEYVPFVKENRKISLLEGAQLPVLAYTQELPALREEYANYSLVHFLPLSLWSDMESHPVTTDAPELYIRVFAAGEATAEKLNTLQSDIERLLSGKYTGELENRIQERASNDSMIAGMQWILGGFCVLLGIIGLANVFLNTLGFLRNRKREFAQYMSVGLTPAQLRRIFRIETLVMAGKPLAITLPLTLLFVEFAISASYLDSREFWQEVPLVPILLFAAGIAAMVSLAYSLGSRKLLQSDLQETLRNDILI